MKEFYVRDRIGMARHVVNHHDGVKTHPDGSKFFDLTICRNKRNLKKFVADLRRQGYVERNHYAPLILLQNDG